eukprot:TRINITY_DN15957_c0_g1_i1.p1 TRINITY_DN15957_c0_g1~~TRINITY_DN15957_c0_g1_i1.p1  ORF type:complete len:180 (+),score=22.10 TRINITY_DN15957_c0_g1_i1:92-631(+)
MIMLTAITKVIVWFFITGTGVEDVVASDIGSREKTFAQEVLRGVDPAQTTADGVFDQLEREGTLDSSQREESSHDFEQAYRANWPLEFQPEFGINYQAGAHDIGSTPDSPASTSSTIPVSESGEDEDHASELDQDRGESNTKTPTTESANKFSSTRTSTKIGRAVQQECRDRSRMPSSA